jgi:glutamyl-tRNA synthetase
MTTKTRLDVTKVRFAPSPTGYLHVGNARIALANFLYARSQRGMFLLRYDDTDTARSREDFADAIGHDLHWLGIEWQETLRQSDRLDRYAAVAERLKAAGRLYPCFESEDELRVKRELRIKRGRAPVYDRAMLALTPAQREAAEAGGKRPYWRFLLSGETVSWVDGVLGRRQVKLPSVSDPVLVRADGSPLYTFTSVVDDIDGGITDIIRGEDHVTNTGVQIDIFRALDAAPPRFAHLPLLTDTDGGKLSKRIDSLSLRNLRADGIEASAVVGYLARLGSSADPVLADVDTLAASFLLSQFSRSAARFDIRQLLALNRRALHALDYDAVAARLPAGADAAFWLAVRGNLDLLSEARHWWDVVAGTIVPPVIEGEQDFLRAACELLPAEPWADDVWAVWIAAIKEATGRGGKRLFAPLRLALTGEDHGPELARLLPLMGRARARARLRLAAK